MWPICCSNTAVKDDEEEAEAGTETTGGESDTRKKPKAKPRRSVVPLPARTRKTPIPAALRAAVWNTYIGDTVGKCKCPVCETNDITPFTFHCGHIVAEANGGPTNLQNLRPICAQCNTSSKKRDMREFKRVHFQRYDDTVWREGFVSPNDSLEVTIHRARIRFRDLETRSREGESLEALLFATGMNVEVCRGMSSRYTPLIGTCYSMDQLYDMILEDIYGIERPLLPLTLMKHAK